MLKQRSLLQRLLVTVVLFLAAGEPGLSGLAHADVLEKPARISARAMSLVQIGLTKAGARLVSVGERGVVLLSDDNGRSWRQAKVPVSVALTRVRFVDAQHGWAVGHSGIVLATRDGGETWDKQLDGIGAAQIEQLAARADTGRDAARRLADADRLVQDGPDKPFFDLHFFDAQRGFVVGAFGTAFMTEDGGKTWHSLMGGLSDANARHLYALHVNGDRVFIVGEQGMVLVSTDQARSFAKVDFPGKGTLFGMLPLGNGGLLAYGLKGNAYRSLDGGKHWAKVEMPPLSLTAGLHLANGSLLLSDESGRLHRSDDSGRSFRGIPVVAPTPLAALVEADDHGLVGSGVRGAARLQLSNEKEEKQQ